MARPASRGAPRRRKVRLFGLTLATGFELACRLPPARGSVDIGFSVVAAPPSRGPMGVPVYESPLLDEAGESLSRLYRLGRGEVLSFGDALDFHLGEERIVCHLRQPEERHLIELRLLGPVLCYWLERMGVCALHASAVVVDGRAVAFMASQRGGKTGLAATMMGSGAPLLTDDLMPVEERPAGMTARPGYPQMRMWPDQLSGIVDDWRALPRVHPAFDKRRLPVGRGGFGEFHDAAAPLAAIYLPERAPEGAAGEVRVRPVSPRETLIELVRNSFSPFIVEAVGLQARRLEVLARLARQVPARRLSYPAGRQAEAAVQRAVIEDLAALERTAGV